MYIIEKNIPLLEPVSGRLERYPLSKMEVGDSFVAPVEMRNRIASAMTNYKKKTGRQFVLRRVEHGVRVWRIA